MKTRLALALGVLLIPVINATAAQAKPSVTSSQTMAALIGQDQYVAGIDGSLFHLTVSLAEKDPAQTRAMQLLVTSYRPVQTRSEVRDVVMGKLTPVIDNVLIDIPASRVDDESQVDLVIPIDITNNTDAGLYLSASGVYPITIQLLQNNKTANQFISFVERLPPDVSRPIPGENMLVSLIATLKGSITLQPDASTVISATDRATISEVLKILQANPQTPLALALPPELIEAFGKSSPEDVTLLTNLDSAKSLHLVSNTYVDIDSRDIVSEQARTIFTDQLRLGEDTLSASLPSHIVTRDSWLQSDPIFVTTGELLRDLGFATIVMLNNAQKTSAGGAGLFADPTRLLELRSPNRRAINAAVADIHLGSALTRGSQNPLGGPYLVAQQMLADMKVLRSEILRGTGTMVGRGLILATDSGILASADMMTALISTLASEPDITIIDLQQLLGSMSVSSIDGQPVGIDLAMDAASQSTPPFSPLPSINERMTAFASMLPDGDDRLTMWHRLTDVIVSRDLSTNERSKYLNFIGLSFNEIGSSVVPPTASTFTLGGRSSAVRFTLRNDSDTDLNVRVRLKSSKLRVTSTDQVLTIAALTTSALEIPVVALSNGRFPVTLQLFTPDGEVPISPLITFTARVNALAGLGQLVTGIALVLLLGWWATHLRSRYILKQGAALPPMRAQPPTNESR